MSQKTKPILLKATVFWAERNTKNRFSDKYQIVLGELSDAAVEALGEINVEVRNKGDDQGNYITCKSKQPIRAKMSDGTEIPDDLLIANGSKAVALVNAYPWSIGDGWSPSLNKLTITELIEYEEEEVDMEAAL